MTITSGANTVTFDATLYPVNRQVQRHQSYSISGDGTARVKDRAIKNEMFTLLIKDDHDNLSNIRSFIENKVKLRLTAFTLTPDPGVNLGNGDGGAVTVRYWDSNFIETQYTYQRYKYTMQFQIE